MLGEVRLAQAGCLDQIASRQLAAAQQFQDGATIGFGDGFERAHGLIFPHGNITVKKLFNSQE